MEESMTTTVVKRMDERSEAPDGGRRSGSSGEGWRQAGQATVDGEK